MAHIEKLTPENYYKCRNIWDIESMPEMAQKWLDELKSGNRIIFVYVENGEYLGEGALVIDSDCSYCMANKNECVYLSRMVVKPECRNRGIGQAILDHLFDYARGMGYKEISIGVDIVNIGARWLYEKNGFTTVFKLGEDEGGKFVKLLKVL